MITAFVLIEAERGQVGALAHQCLCQPIPLHRGIVVAGPLRTVP